MTADIEKQESGDRMVRKGTVLSRSGDKSIVVQIERRKRHPLYGKVVRVFKKFHAHDANNEAAVGDRVVIQESRPISRLKRWRVLSVNSSRDEASRKAGEE